MEHIPGGHRSEALVHSRNSWSIYLTGIGTRAEDTKMSMVSSLPLKSLLSDSRETSPVNTCSAH